ncbi:MAG: HAD family hydrolase [Lachnospiraceae bacterium]
MIYIMDLDGTLIDSTKRHYVLMEKIIEDEMNRGNLPVTMGKKFDAHEFMAYKADGKSGKSYLTEKLCLSLSEAECIMTLWGEKIESEEMLALDRLYPDAIPSLERIVNSGNIVIFLTARQREDLVQKQLQDLQIFSYATEIFVVNPKNAAEEKCRVVKELLQRTGTKSALTGQTEPEGNTALEKNVIVVGDTENEWTLANELHLPCYLLSRGFRSKTFWDKKGCIAMEDLCRLP